MLLYDVQSCHDEMLEKLGAKKVEVGKPIKTIGAEIEKFEAGKAFTFQRKKR
jgi:hypothetical protein